MKDDRPDCSWCGSAASVEYGVCQVCLMEFPNEAVVIKLPLESKSGDRKIPLEEPKEAGVAE